MATPAPAAMMDDCSFIVQGPIRPNTRECLASIRKYYPEAKIVLSTWRGENTSALAYDTLVLSEDPGATEWQEKTFNNTNRQIVSTLSGIKAVKTRTDIEIIGNNLQPLLESLEPGRSNLFALNLFFRNPLKYPLLFHIGDIFQFGTTKDLLDLWDIPLQPEPETSEWGNTHAHPLNEWKGFSPRYTPEQYVFLSYLKKKGVDVELDFCNQMTTSLAVISENKIAETFRIFSRRELGIKIPAHFNEADVAKYLYTQDQLDKITKTGPDSSALRKHITKRNWSLLVRFLTSPKEIVKYALTLPKTFQTRLGWPKETPPQDENSTT